MNYNNLFRSFRQTMHHRPTAGMLTAMLMMLAAAGCTDDADNDNRLPDGKYPMTFSAAVDGLIVSRATGKDAWAENDEVAIQINGKTKKYTAASDGSLTVAGSDAPFYWQSTGDITVNAWYPYNDGTKPTDSDLRVKADQTTDNNYQESDYLEAVDATVTFNQTASLAFKHRTAKVVVTLQAGDFVTDLTSAAVTFVNQIGVDGNGTEVTPKTETTSGGVTTYSALLIPQNMQGKQFIKVTLGGNTYYYTPKGMENANLRAGYVENYTITVKQNGLSVVWQQGEQIDNTAEKATFKIYLNAFTAPQYTSYKVTDADGTKLQATDGVYTLTGNELNISLTVDEGYALSTFSTAITAGIGKRTKTLANNTYTYKFYDIRSDLWLSAVQATITSSPIEYTNVSVGDYYYSDGTCSSTLDKGKTCIGIVFKTGTGQGDDIDNYDFLVDNTIHGYVAALTNANSGSGSQWSTTSIATGVSTSQENFDGYSNTLILKEKENSKDIFPAVWACINNNDVSAPVSSSGWYLPSCAQLKEFHGQSNNIKSNIEAVSGSVISSSSTVDYWTSNEDVSDAIKAWHFSTYSNGTFWNDHAKTNSDYVRAILTF